MQGPKLELIRYERGIFFMFYWLLRDPKCEGMREGISMGVSRVTIAGCGAREAWKITYRRARIAARKYVEG